MGQEYPNISLMNLWSNLTIISRKQDQQINIYYREDV